jgi:hypothetical protein
MLGNGVEKLVGSGVFGALAVGAAVVASGVLVENGSVGWLVHVAVALRVGVFVAVMIAGGTWFLTLAALARTTRFVVLTACATAILISGPATTISSSSSSIACVSISVSTVTLCGSSCTIRSIWTICSCTTRTASVTCAGVAPSAIATSAAACAISRCTCILAVLPCACQTRKLL